jgi:multiple sugar transport system permease protein
MGIFRRRADGIWKKKRGRASMATMAETKIKVGKRKKKLFTEQFVIRNGVILAIAVFYGLFTINPIIQAFLGSFHQWNPLKGEYIDIGFENYEYALGDDLFWSSMLNNLIFTGVIVVARTALSLLIALAINSVTRLKSVFRTVFFIPVISSMVAIAYVWRWMYDPSIGLINTTLAGFGITGLNWLLDPSTALIAVMIMTVWKDLGYGVVIYLAGILNLPKEVYEAASIDGANKLQIFRRVTLPLLTGTTLLIVITSLISYLQSFTQIFVMTAGGPGTRTYLTTYLIYYEAFVKYNFGYASAISFFLFLVISVLTAVQFKVLGKNQGR